MAKKKKKKPQREPELSENSDASLELSSELEESDEEQPTAKAATATGAHTNKRRYPRRERKKFVEINIDYEIFREEGTWGASDSQRKKKKAV